MKSFSNKVLNKLTVDKSNCDRFWNVPNRQFLSKLLILDKRSCIAERADSQVEWKWSAGVQVLDAVQRAIFNRPEKWLKSKVFALSIINVIWKATVTNYWATNTFINIKSKKKTLLRLWKPQCFNENSTYLYHFQI